MIDNDNDNENNLFNEALLDLAIIIKRNVDLRNENEELRKRMEENSNSDSKQFNHKKLFKKGR